jgi:hypothetical protein
MVYILPASPAELTDKSQPKPQQTREHCPSYRSEPSSLPILAAQRVDADALARDAEQRGWIDEAERHHKLIARLDTLIADTEAQTG